MTHVPGWAVRGAKVVCIGDFKAGQQFVSDPCGRISYPERLTVYTIREVRVRLVTESMEVMTGILLVELTNPLADLGSGAGEEMAWDVNGFAPLVQRKDTVGLSIMEKESA